jgi:hypothetical protein
MAYVTSPDMLRRDTVALLKEIEAQIDSVKETAQTMGIPPEKLQDTNGNWVMSPLLLAKVQALAILVQLNTNARR